MSPLHVNWPLSSSVSLWAEWRQKPAGGRSHFSNVSRNNGLFFPGSQLHPHRCFPIGSLSLSIPQHRKLWQNRNGKSSQWVGKSKVVTHFQSHYSWLKKTVFSSSGKKIKKKKVIWHTLTFFLKSNELRSVYVIMTQMKIYWFCTDPQLHILSYLNWL